MRLAPVPMRYVNLYPDQLPELLTFADESSIPTHASRQCRSACRYMTLVVAALIHGEPREVVLSPDWAPLRQLRELEPLHPAVEEIAQGRVWVGSRAQELGLVDTVGGLDAAIARAAELAGLEDYGVRRITPPLSPREMLLRQLTGTVSAEPPDSFVGSAQLPPLLREAGAAWKLLNTFNDPRHNYALCLACAVQGVLR